MTYVFLSNTTEPPQVGQIKRDQQGLWVVWTGDAWFELRPPVAKTEENVRTVHAVPLDGLSGMTPCCGRPLFELSRMDCVTRNPTEVTCHPVTACAPTCNGTWPGGRPFHVRDCPNGPLPEAERVLTVPAPGWVVLNDGGPVLVHKECGQQVARFSWSDKPRHAVRFTHGHTCPLSGAEVRAYLDVLAWDEATALRGERWTWEDPQATKSSMVLHVAKDSVRRTGWRV